MESVVYIPNNYLEHHGIAGQRWGQRNGPPYPLGAEDHSASEKKARWQYSLNKKSRIGAMTDKAAGKKRKASSKTTSPLQERILSPVKKSALMLKEGILDKDTNLLKLGTTRSMSDEGLTIKKGSKVQHVMSTPVKDLTSRDYLFVAATEADKKNYAGYFAALTKFRNNVDQMYKMKMTALNDLVSPSFKERVDIFLGLYEEDKEKVSRQMAEFNKRNYESQYKETTEELVKKYSNMTLRQLKKEGYYIYANSWFDPEAGTLADMKKVLKERGYNAIIDDNDKRSFMQSEAPLIVFDILDNLGDIKVEKLTQGEIRRNMVDWQNMKHSSGGEDMDCVYISEPSSLYHHGIIGQKWGVRRYQNEDGTLTEEGRKRYRSEENFEKVKERNAEIKQAVKDGLEITLSVMTLAASAMTLASLSGPIAAGTLSAGSAIRLLSSYSITKNRAEMVYNVATKSKTASLMTKKIAHSSGGEDMDCVYISEPSSLYHHGILGQKWGVRRYQNEDGTLTEAGKKRYGSEENFKYQQRRKEVISNNARMQVAKTAALTTALAINKIGLVALASNPVTAAAYVGGLAVASIIGGEMGSRLTDSFTYPKNYDKFVEKMAKKYTKKNENGEKVLNLVGMGEAIDKFMTGGQKQIELVERLDEAENDKDIDPETYKRLREETYLTHHGILGMHWGVRRYQNADGTLTPLGRKRVRSIRDYSDEELRKEIARTRLEKEYNREVGRGSKFYKRSLIKNPITGKVNTSRMRDDELEAYIDRLYLEKRLSDLEAQEVQRGLNYIRDLSNTISNVSSTAGNVIGLMNNIAAYKDKKDSKKNKKAEEAYKKSLFESIEKMSDEDLKKGKERKYMENEYFKAYYTNRHDNSNENNNDKKDKKKK